MMTNTTTKPAGKAPAPRGRKTHRKPAGAPKASPMGYIMGASMVLKMLIDQAVQQGEDRDALKAQAMAYIMAI